MSKAFEWLNTIMDNLGQISEDRPYLAEELASYLLPFCVDGHIEGESPSDTVKRIIKERLKID